MKIISRKEAKARGLKRYFTGKPCKRGHVSPRFITCVCVECNNLAQRVAYVKNPEKKRQAAAKWAAHNPERVRETRRIWHAKNPGRYRESKRRWKANNLEKVRENRREYHRRRYAKDPEGQRERGRVYRAANPQKTKEIASRSKRKERLINAALRSIIKKLGYDINQLNIGA